MEYNKDVEATIKNDDQGTGSSGVNNKQSRYDLFQENVKLKRLGCLKKKYNELEARVRNLKNLNQPLVSKTNKRKRDSLPG